MPRIYDVEKFYGIMENLEKRLGGKRVLEKCDGRMSWPRRGIYFFFNEDENRAHSGTGPRVVRIGTHALEEKSKTTLWERLRQHRGTLIGRYPGGGSQRGSVFRKHVGFAIINKRKIICPSWGEDHISKEERDLEYEVEKEVSDYIRKMPFLWLKVDDVPDLNSMRAFIERNAIALLSNYNRDQIDPQSENWLGKYSKNEKVRRSGMWNDDYTDKKHDTLFLDILQNLIKQW